MGAQLRRRRRELGHRRVDAAALIGTGWKSLMWWERDERAPAAFFFPALIRYLGSEPWQEPQTLADALRAERLRRGLTVNQAAAVVGIDPGTWGRWERGKWKPTTRTLPRIDTFLGYSAAVRFPADIR